MPEVPTRPGEKDLMVTGFAGWMGKYFHSSTFIFHFYLLSLHRKTPSGSLSLLNRLMLEWWNGRHERLKIFWSLRPCGFKSRFEHSFFAPFRGYASAP